MCLLAFFYSGQIIQPQVPLVNNSNSGGFINIPMDDDFHKLEESNNDDLLDSIMEENRKLTIDINKNIDVINNNNGYIYNLEKKIEQRNKISSYKIKKPISLPIDSSYFKNDSIIINNEENY